MEILKRTISKILLLMVFSFSFAHASLDDFLAGTPTGAQFDYAKPSSISTQVRGYYNFGGASVRNYGLSGVIRPFHLEAPSIHSGCSGIDAVLGGFSYLNIEYLVEKLQKIVSAAPAFVFQLALATLCKDCQQILQELEAIADAINGINFDGCKAAVNWGKAIGNYLNNETSVGDNPISALTSKGAKGLSEAGKWIGDHAATLNATINCTDGGAAGICDSKQDKKGKKQIEKRFFQGSMLSKFFEEGSSSDDFLTKLQNDTDFVNWFGKTFTNKLKLEEFFRALFGDLYGYVDPVTCTAGGDSEGAATKAFRIILIKPTESNTDLIRNFFFSQESNSTKKEFKITKIIETPTTCGSDKALNQDIGFKSRPDINQDSNVTLSPVEGGVSLTTYLLQRVQEIAKAVDNNDAQTVKKNITFLDSLNYPSYKAINLYTISRDEVLLHSMVKYIMAVKAKNIVSKIVTASLNMQNLIMINETTDGINDSDLKVYNAHLDKMKNEISRVAQQEELAAKKMMQDRMAQIQVYQNIEKTLKQGMYGTDGSGSDY